MRDAERCPWNNSSRRRDNAECSENGEIVTHVELPESSSSMVGSYQKLRQREAWDFPEGGVAFAVQVDKKGNISGLNMASTGFESIPRSHKDLVDSIDMGAEWGLEAKRLGVELKRTVRPVLNTWFLRHIERKWHLFSQRERWKKQ